MRIRTTTGYHTRLPTGRVDSGDEPDIQPDDVGPCRMPGALGDPGIESQGPQGLGRPGHGPLEVPGQGQGLAGGIDHEEEQGQKGHQHQQDDRGVQAPGEVAAGRAVGEAQHQHQAEGQQEEAQNLRPDPAQGLTRAAAPGEAGPQLRRRGVCACPLVQQGGAGALPRLAAAPRPSGRRPWRPALGKSRVIPSRASRWRRCPWMKRPTAIRPAARRRISLGQTLTPSISVKGSPPRCRSRVRRPSSRRVTPAKRRRWPS